jgi:hypothetical protein
VGHPGRKFALLFFRRGAFISSYRLDGELDVFARVPEVTVIGLLDSLWPPFNDRNQTPPDRFVDTIDVKVQSSIVTIRP